MTRKKVKLAFIANDSSRKATFKKRKKGLLKKVNELSTLCGINACAIIYSPYDTNPEVWPSNSGVQRIISDFRKLPEMDQNKKMVDQETFLRQRIAKASENLKKQRKDNREMEMTEVMFQCLVGNMGMFNLNIMDLNDLGYMIDQYLKDVNRRIEILGSSGGMELGEPSNDAAAAPSETARTLAVMPTTTATIQPHHHHHHHQQQQLFRHHAAPHVGHYEQPLNLNLSHNQNQQQWFTEMMMNHPEQMNYAAEQMGFPFMNDNHHQQQQRQTPGESSTTPATTVSTSSVNPVTSSNPTNNIWFR